MIMEILLWRTYRIHWANTVLMIQHEYVILFTYMQLVLRYKREFSLQRARLRTDRAAAAVVAASADGAGRANHRHGRDARRRQR